MTRPSLIKLTFQSIALTTGMVASALAAPKLVLGWLEPVDLVGKEMRVKAKLDVGALTSSMHAQNIERFERDGETWVRFEFTHENELTQENQTLELEGPLVRNVLIKRHGAPSIRRPVITHTFCLYNQIYRAEFSLTDRTEFIYPILLGRSFLSEVALIDSSETFLSEPICTTGEDVVDILD
ncbi:MAG: RimK/LysX family protein [Pseudomonadota bacterium]